jgi:hypothetical protein
MNSMPAAMDAELQALTGRRIFFGHQSVGANILDGLRAICRDSRHPLAIVEHREGSAWADDAAGALGHARIGQNEQPLTKCDAFRRIVDEELSGRIDIALFKFCYIDIGEHTDTDALFDRYRETLDDLASRHQHVLFVPVTVPLRNAPGGLGVLARELLGRPNRSKAANLARHRFNERVRQTYSAGPVFDLAGAEATRPDGSRESFRYQGRTGEGLAPMYTDDGGHLNAEGQRAVAAAFIRALAAAARRIVD